MDLPEKESTLKRRRSFAFRLGKWFIPKFFYSISYFIFGTARIRYQNKESFDRFVANGESIIVACFHQGILFLPFLLRHKSYGKRIAMVSTSPEGDYIADAMNLFGQVAARGSSTRGGKNALQVMIDMVNFDSKEQSHALITVDGPKGPAGEAKMGVVKLAKKTGLPVIPINWYATPAFTCKNWDQTLLPSPFSKLVISYGDAIFVDEDADEKQMEEFRKKITSSLQSQMQIAKSLKTVSNIKK